MFTGEIKRQRMRDGKRYRYRWRAREGRILFCTRCTDFIVDGDF